MEARDERRLLRLQKQLVSHKLLVIAKIGANRHWISVESGR
jgi:hypothetical protein